MGLSDPDRLAALRDRPILDLQGIQRTRDDGERRFVLEVPSFTLFAGDRLALVGGSGTGKSTLIDVLALALAPDSGGRFHLIGPDGDTVDIGDAWRRDRDGQLTRLRARTFGYVQQVGGLLNFLTVRGNIQLSRRIAGVEGCDTVEEIAAALGIRDHLDRFPDRLSVGQRQRVAIARALSHRPRIILADEPTASLDPETASAVMGLLVDECAREGTALIVASHDHRLVDEHGLERVSVIPHGDSSTPRSRVERSPVVVG